MTVTIVLVAAYIALICTVSIVGFAWFLRGVGFWLRPPVLFSPWLWLLIWVCFFAAFLPTVTDAAELPSNPVQRCAAKALAGEFGELEQWQRQGYTKLLYLDKPPTEKLAWITVYNENDPGCNETGASGRHVSHRMAAMIDKPWATWVLVDLDTGYQLRQIFDTGSRRNIWRAQNPKKCGSSRPPAQTWIDLYYSPAAMRTLKEKHNQSWVRPIFIF